MHVFLIRHATAIDETLAIADSARYLSDHGRRQARSLGDRLRWHDCSPTHVWASPLVRAVQTAELVVAGLHCDAIIEIVPALAHDQTTKDVVAAIRALPAEALLVVVGHEPGLSAIGALLTGDERFDPLARASAVRIDDGRVRWRFVWDADAPVIAAVG